MSFESAQKLHEIFVLLFYLAGTCIVAHVALSFALRAAIRAGDLASDQVFCSPNPFVMRPRFFWPWTPSPSGVDSRDLPTRVLFWGARLTGAGFILGFLGLLCLAGINYLATR